MLTDADFGRAYLTQGWARRFVQQLFSKYVVLFVGYSHQDLPLLYLARGISAAEDGPGRYAITLRKTIRFGSTSASNRRTILCA